MSILPLNQDITYWTIASSNSNNVITWNAGIAIKGRWVRKDGVVKGLKGKDQKTEFVAYSTILIPKRSMIVLENQNLVATPPDGSRELVQSIENPSMTNLIKYLF